MRLRTQWNSGMAGPTGMRYEAAYPLIDRMTKDAPEWNATFDDLQAMEQAALAAMHDKS